MAAETTVSVHTAVTEYGRIRARIYLTLAGINRSARDPLLQGRMQFLQKKGIALNPILLESPFRGPGTVVATAAAYFASSVNDTKRRHLAVGAQNALLETQRLLQVAQKNTALRAAQKTALENVLRSIGAPAASAAASASSVALTVEELSDVQELHDRAILLEGRATTLCASATRLVSDTSNSITLKRPVALALASRLRISVATGLKRQRLLEDVVHGVRRLVPGPVPSDEPPLSPTSPVNPDVDEGQYSPTSPCTPVEGAPAAAAGNAMKPAVEDGAGSRIMDLLYADRDATIASLESAKQATRNAAQELLSMDAPRAAPPEVADAEERLRHLGEEIYELSLDLLASDVQTAGLSPCDSSSTSPALATMERYMREQNGGVKPRIVMKVRVLRRSRQHDDAGSDKEEEEQQQSGLFQPHGGDNPYVYQRSRSHSRPASPHAGLSSTENSPRVATLRTTTQASHIATYGSLAVNSPQPAAAQHTGAPPRHSSMAHAHVALAVDGEEAKQPEAKAAMQPASLSNVAQTHSRASDGTAPVVQVAANSTQAQEARAAEQAAQQAAPKQTVLEAAPVFAPPTAQLPPSPSAAGNTDITPLQAPLGQAASLTGGASRRLGSGEGPPAPILSSQQAAPTGVRITLTPGYQMRAHNESQGLAPSSTSLAAPAVSGKRSRAHNNEDEDPLQTYYNEAGSQLSWEVAYLISPSYYGLSHWRLLTEGTKERVRQAALSAHNIHAADRQEALTLLQQLVYESRELSAQAGPVPVHSLKYVNPWHYSVGSHPDMFAMHTAAPAKRQRLAPAAAPTAPSVNHGATTDAQAAYEIAHQAAPLSVSVEARAAQAMAAQLAGQTRSAYLSDIHGEGSEAQRAGYTYRTGGFSQVAYPPAGYQLTEEQELSASESVLPHNTTDNELDAQHAQEDALYDFSADVQVGTFATDGSPSASIPRPPPEVLKRSSAIYARDINPSGPPPPLNAYPAALTGATPMPPYASAAHKRPATTAPEANAAKRQQAQNIPSYPYASAMALALNPVPAQAVPAYTTAARSSTAPYPAPAQHSQFASRTAAMPSPQAWPPVSTQAPQPWATQQPAPQPLSRGCFAPAAQTYTPPQVAQQPAAQQQYPPAAQAQHQQGPLSFTQSHLAQPPPLQYAQSTAQAQGEAQPEPTVTEWNAYWNAVRYWEAESDKAPVTALRDHAKKQLKQKHLEWGNQYPQYAVDVTKIRRLLLSHSSRRMAMRRAVIITPSGMPRVAFFRQASRVIRVRVAILNGSVASMASVPMLASNAKPADVLLYVTTITTWLELTNKVGEDRYEAALLLGVSQHANAHASVRAAMERAGAERAPDERFFEGIKALVAEYGPTRETVRMTQLQLATLRAGPTEAATVYFDRYMRARIEAYAGEYDKCDQIGVAHFVNSLQLSMSRACSSFTYLGPDDEAVVGTPMIYIRSWQELRQAYLTKDRELSTEARTADIHHGLLTEGFHRNFAHLQGGGSHPLASLIKQQRGEDQLHDAFTTPTTTDAQRRSLARELHRMPVHDGATAVLRMALMGDGHNNPNTYPPRNRNNPRNIKQRRADATGMAPSNTPGDVDTDTDDTGNQNTTNARAATVNRPPGRQPAKRAPPAAAGARGNWEPLGERRHAKQEGAADSGTARRSGPCPDCGHPEHDWADCPRNSKGSRPSEQAMRHAGQGKLYTGRYVDGRIEYVKGRSAPRNTKVRLLKVDRHGQRELLIHCSVGTVPFDHAVIDTGSMATCIDEQHYLAHRQALGPLDRQAAEDVRIEGIGGHHMGAIGIMHRRVTYHDPRTNCNYTTPRPLELVVVRNLGTKMLLGMSAMAGANGITHLGTETGDVFFGANMLRAPAHSPHPSRSFAVRLCNTVHLPAGATQPVRIRIQAPNGCIPSTAVLIEAAPMTLASAPGMQFHLGMPCVLTTLGGACGDGSRSAHPQPHQPMRVPPHAQPGSHRCARQVDGRGRHPPVRSHVPRRPAAAAASATRATAAFSRK